MTMKGIVNIQETKEYQFAKEVESMLNNYSFSHSVFAASIPFMHPTIQQLMYRLIRECLKLLWSFWQRTDDIYLTSNWFTKMKTNTIYILYTLVDCGECVSDCHTLYSTLEKAKAAMEVEIQECMKNFRHGEVKHDFERLYEFMNEDGQGFTVGIDEQIPQ